MTPPAPRWRRSLIAATAVCLLAVTACSSDGDPRRAGTPSPSPSPAASGSVSSQPDPVARLALARVAAATRALTSYAFSAAQTAGATTTRINGRAVRPGALTYTLDAGGRVEQVVRINRTTFRRIPPAGYRRLTRSEPSVDPLSSLVKVLTGLRDVTRTPGPSGTVFRGTLDGATAAASGLVGEARPVPGIEVPVVVTADVSAHVTRFTADVPLSVRGMPVRVKQVTAFSGFNRQPAIVAPR